jgi:DNA-binding transcriptional ArsR family regulator
VSPTTTEAGITARADFLVPVVYRSFDRYIGSWQYSDMPIDMEAGLRALANDKRLQILFWLKDPTTHFRPQVDGDLVKDGVCGQLIAEKLGVSQPTASEHLRVLTDARFLAGKKIRQWVFYKRQEKAIVAFKMTIKSEL